MYAPQVRYFVFFLAVHLCSLLQMAISCLIKSHAHQRLQHLASFTLYLINQTVQKSYSETAWQNVFAEKSGLNSPHNSSWDPDMPFRSSGTGMALSGASDNLLVCIVVSKSLVGGQDPPGLAGKSWVGGQNPPGLASKSRLVGQCRPRIGL